MPRIPQYNQQTRATGAGLGPDASATGINPSVAQDIATVVPAVLDAVAASQERRAMADASDRTATLRLRAMEAFEKGKTAALDDADGFTPTMLRTFDDLVTDVADGAPRRSKELLRQQARNLREELAGRSMAFEAGTALAFRENKINSGISSLVPVLKADPDQWRNATADQLHLIDTMPIEPAERVRLRSKMVASLSEAAASGVARKNPALALQNLATLQSGDSRFDSLDDDARERVTVEARNALVQNGATSVLSAYETGGAAAGIARQAEVLKAVPEELRDDARSAINSQLNGLRTQRREQYAGALAAVETAISTDTAGEATRQQVRELWNAGALTPSDFANYEARIAQAKDKRNADTKALAAVSGILSAGMPVDPGNAEQMRGLDAAFRRDSEGTVVGDPRFQAAAAGYAGLARVLPVSADSWLSSAARSPSAQVAVAAAQFFGQLQDSAPEAAAKIDADTKAMLGLMASMVKAGTPPQAAYETARANVFETRRDVVELRKQALSTKEVRDGNTSALTGLVDRDFDTAFSSQPAVPDALKADFEGGVASYFQKTGNLAVARKQAWADVRRIWGRSEVNGAPQLMAYAPETMYPGLTAEAIRTDLGKVLAPLQVNADEVRLMPSIETARSNGQRWSLVTKDKYGADEVVRGANGQPLRYALPIQALIDQQTSDIAEHNALKVISDAEHVGDARARRAEGEAAAARTVEQARKGRLPRRGGLD